MYKLQILDIFDTICFAYFGFSVLYLFTFAFLSKFKRNDQYPPVIKCNRFLILFPSYKEDSTIESSIQSFLKQKYPSDYYEILIISDQMREETNKRLEKFPVRLLKVHYEHSTKAKALNFAMDSLEDKTFDIVVILDADNIVEPDFLYHINRAYQAGAIAIQAHRTGKNLNSDVALLDAASEEMNNAYFRKGHVFLGLSSALSGSGMAFDYSWFHKNIKKVTSAGEDKELEILLLKQRIYIEYLHDVYVYDEKVQNSSAFSNQRKRWLAAQLGSLKIAIHDFPNALFTGNIDYADKLIQWMMLPRILLLGFLFLLSLSFSVIQIDLALKWWSLFLLLLLTFGLAVPKNLDNKALEKAILKIPKLFIIMFLNLFRLKDANKNFIHTSHE